MDAIYLLLGVGFFLLCWVLAAVSDRLREE